MDMEEVRRAIDAGNAEWIAAFRASDAERLAGLFDESGAMLQDDGQYARGRDAIHESIGKVMARFGPTETTINTDGVWVIDDVAYETGRYTYTYTPEGGTRTEAAGRYIVRWKRQHDDTWKIEMDLGLPD